MDYLKHYNRLVLSRKFRGLDKKALGFYTEKHHIQPRAVGGNNAKANLVLLTAREHLIAHKLLWKSNKDIKPYRVAYFMMVNGGLYKTTSREYERIKLLYIQNQSGKGNHFYGKKHTEEAKRKTGEASRGHKRISAETYKKIALKNTGKVRSKAVRKKISEKALVHMSKPWRCSGVVIRQDCVLMWACADLVYDLWKDTSLGIRKLTNLYNEVYCDLFHPSKLRTMLGMFRDGWIPLKDEEWLIFREQNT